MSAYTDARSRPGSKAGGADDRALFLIEFGGMVIQAYDESMTYGDLHWVRQITQGKSDSFPIIGRKRDATEHVPGELILGGTVEDNEVVITVDNMLVDSAFVAEIDELISHFQVAAPYAKQIGQSLGSTMDKRIANMHVLASRLYTSPAQGQPIPAYYWATDLKTNAARLEDAAFASKQYLLENDISGDMPGVMLPFLQYLLLARYTGLEAGETTGTANRATGTIGQMAGLNIKGSNHTPRTNVTTGNAKYRGDFSATVGHCSSRMAVGTLELRAMKMVMKEQDDRLGTLMIGSMLNGHGALRPECSIEWTTAQTGGRVGLNGA